MRVLGVSETCDLGALYLSLVREGHEVRVAVSEPLARGTLAGLVPRTPDWRAELDWIRAAGPEGIILFESVSEGFGALQDRLRAEGFNVIGGSAYGDRLENDRAYAQEVFAGLGFPAGHVWEFDRPADAAAFIAARPARYVLKFSGPGYASSDNYVGQLPDGRDVSAILRCRAAAGPGAADRFILMRHIEGVEMATGAYFNGEAFLEPACLDWEHKRFFAGDLGELTGEMGTVVTFDRSQTFFRRLLAPMAPRLAAAGHVGWVNINAIVNEAGVWPLEFSCRFGYPGFAILSPLQPPWGELLGAVAARTPLTLNTRPGFGVGVVVTTPPLPYTRKEIPDAPVGLPVLIDDGAEPAHFHYGEMGLDASGQLVTAGLYGWTMVVTGTGASVAAARAAAYANLARAVVPNGRWRLDIGDRLIAGDLARVERLGLLDPEPTPATPPQRRVESPA